MTYDIYHASPTKRTRPFISPRLLGLGLVIGLMTLVSISVHAQDYDLPIPLGLDKDEIVIPKDNPLSKQKVELGKLLFFDKRLSKNNTIACASCHMPSVAFTDGQAVSSGIHRLQGGRSAPTAINRVFSSAQFWDGRAPTLEAQSVGPFVSPVEHGFADHDELVEKVKSIAGYQPLFQETFGGEATTPRIGQAIASFQRTLLSGNSPYDKFTKGGDKGALTSSAQRGFTLFLTKARCIRCHSGANFSDETFHNLGIDWDGDHIDLGRYTVSKDPNDIGAFKTPTLREIAKTAPYMHDGRLATLKQVVEFYNGGGIKNPHLDKTIVPLKLTEEEQNDIVAFLYSLNGEGWNVTAPKHFPQ